jgi:hypothetical protein
MRSLWREQGALFSYSGISSNEINGWDENIGGPD